MSLRISLLVKRCAHPEHQSGRVRFLIGSRCRPGEAIVLRRWRDRACEPSSQVKGVTFDGCRLPPGTFQLLSACRSSGLEIGRPVSVEVLRPYYENARSGHPLWRAPRVDHTAALLTFLVSRGLVQQVLDRDRSPANPGIPDLFLWRHTADGVPFGGRFVEVKRYAPRAGFKEPVSREQKAELAFLQGLGLKAQITYLIQ